MSDGLFSQHKTRGRALWGTHAVWAYVLDTWMKKNTLDPKQEPEDWGGIEFDKLAHLLHLMWNALAETISEHGLAAVSFFSIYQTADGVHGPGPALPERERPNRHIHLLDALYILQSKLGEITPDAHLFRLGIRGVSGKRHYKVHLGRERTWLPLHLSQALPPAWEQRDEAYAKMLGELISGLSQEEIRALGTHQTKAGTIKALEYNVFVHLFRRFIDETEFIEKRGHVVQKGKRRGASDLPSLAYVIDEIRRKSNANANEACYRLGLGKLQKSAKQNDPVAKVAVEKIFQAPDTIWVKDVRDWETVGKRMEALHSYLVALRHVYLPGDPPVDPDEKLVWELTREKERTEGEKAITRIQAWYRVDLPALPEDAIAIYPWEELRGAVVVIFDSLKGETPYFERYKHYAQRYRRQNEAL
jgi:hypothetical protein